MKKKIKIFIILVLIGILVAFAVLNKPEKEVSYRTSEAQIGNIETIVSGTGTLTAKKERKEYSKVAGEVKEIYFEEGDSVLEGDLIIKLDSSRYDSQIKAQEISIKQAQLSKSNIEKQINDLKVVAESDGYVNGLTISKGSYVTNTMAVCNIVKDSKFEVVLEFTYYANNPIMVGTSANVTLLDSFSSMTGTVTKVSDMRKLITGNAQVVDVTIEVETTGYSLAGALAKAEIYNGVTILQSANTATFKSVNSDVVRAKTSGTVQDVLVNEGKKVNAGEVIAILINPDLETSLQNANLTLENLNNQLANLKDQLKDYEVTSPINGTITNQSVKSGDMVAAGTLLTTITDKEAMEFIIPIDELDIAKLNYDQEVRVTIDAISETEDNPLIGKITSIPHEGITTAGVTDYYVTIEVAGNENMKISMNANADIVVESVKDVLYIPVDAIIKDNGKRYVDVLLDDGITVERKEIEVGASDITNIEVKSGIKKGEKVIIPEVNSGISFF